MRPFCKILAHVAQDVRELQTDSESVSERIGRDRIRRLEDADREPPDRTRDAPAVMHEVGERLIRRAPDVELAAVDELEERRYRNRQSRCRVSHGEQNRVGGGAADRLDVAPGVVEQSQLLVGWQRAVADVVDAASQRVHRC